MYTVDYQLPLATTKNIYVPPSVKRYFTEVRTLFGNTFIKVHKTLSRHNYPLESLKKNFLSSHRHLKPQVSECNTIEDFILNVVQKECDLIDITVLRNLVELTEINEAKVHIESYQEAVDEFCETMQVKFALKESFLAKGFSLPLRAETIEVTVDWKINKDDQHTLYDVKLLLSDALGRLSIYAKLVVMKQSNSIVIICSFPIHLTSLLIAEATSNLKLLKKQGLLKLTIGYCTIWNHRDEVNKN